MQQIKRELQKKEGTEWSTGTPMVIWHCIIMALCWEPGPNFIEVLSTKICLTWNFFLDKNRITNQISIWCILPVTGIQLLFAYPENRMEIWFEILFLWRPKFHAKQIFLLSSSMKLGPGRVLPKTKPKEV